MQDWLKDTLLTVGSTVTSIIAILTVFKPLISSLIEKLFSTTLDKNLAKYNNILTRSTMAYELLLERELEFYKKVEPLLGELIPLVLDINCTALNEYKQPPSEQKESIRKYAIRYLEIIPMIKNFLYIHQTYIPLEIFNIISRLIVLLQNNAENLSNVVNSCFDDERIQVIDFSKEKDETLMLIALINTKIKSQLQKLSSM